MPIRAPVTTDSRAVTGADRPLVIATGVDYSIGLDSWSDTARQTLMDAIPASETTTAIMVREDDYRAMVMSSVIIPDRTVTGDRARLQTRSPSLMLAPEGDVWRAGATPITSTTATFLFSAVAWAVVTGGSGTISTTGLGISITTTGVHQLDKIMWPDATRSGTLTGYYVTAMIGGQVSL